MVQESPIHTLASLDSLLAMASKKGKRESILATGEYLKYPQIQVGKSRSVVVNVNYLSISQLLT